MKITWHCGDVIRKLREQAGVTQREVSEEVGVRAATVGRIESSGRYRPETLKKIADMLSVSEADILSLIPGAGGEVSAEERANLLCDKGDHARYQRMVDTVFHSDAQISEWLRGSIIMCYEGATMRSRGRRRRELDNVAMEPVIVGESPIMPLPDDNGVKLRRKKPG